MPDPTDARPATRRYEDKREKLLSAASALFNERGVVGTTLADVADSVGLVKSSVTYYYRRKEDLAVACFMRAIAHYDGLVAQAAQAAGTAGRVAALIRLQFDFQAQVVAGARPGVVMFHEIRSLSEPQSAEVFDAYNALFRRIRALLRSEDSAGWTRDQLNARTHLLLSQVHAITPLVQRYEREDYPRICKAMTDIVLHGLASPASAWWPAGIEADWLDRIPEQSPNAQFLRAATEIMNEQGYAGASVNRIAERLKLTKGGFYYYNENKNDLVAQCFEQSFATIRRAVNFTEPYVDLPAWEHLCSIARGLVRFQLSEAGPLLRSTAHSALPDPDLRGRVGGTLGRITERLAGVIVSGQADGSIRLLDPALAAQLTLAGIASAAELGRWVRSATADNAAELLARPLMTGLLAPAADGG